MASHAFPEPRPSASTEQTFNKDDHETSRMSGKVGDKQASRHTSIEAAQSQGVAQDDFDVFGKEESADSESAHLHTL